MKKCGSYPINDFEGWPPSSSKRIQDLVFFAVKKEHDIGYKYDYKQKVLTFEEKINQAILESKSDFLYRGHTYSLRKNKDDNFDIESNGKKIAEAMASDYECIVDLPPENVQYVKQTISPYYVRKYKDLFSKTRIKKYGINSNEEVEF